MVGEIFKCVPESLIDDRFHVDAQKVTCCLRVSETSQFAFLQKGVWQCGGIMKEVGIMINQFLFHFLFKKLRETMLAILITCVC